jgi:hypothetical protein
VRNRWILGWLIAALLYADDTPVLAQDLSSQLKYYQRNTEYVLRNAAALVRPVLSRDERRIQDSVTVRVPAEAAMIAQAYPGYIVISAGFAAVLSQLALSNIADYALGFEGCDSAFATYVAEGIVDNSARVTKGQSLRVVYGVELYGRRFGGPCDGFRTQSISETGNGELFASLVEASLMFLYLHELCHHLLEHVDRAPANLDYSRRKEAEADACAISLGFRADYNVMAGAPMMNLLGVLGGASIEAELKQLHPLGMRRVRDMLRQAREILISNGDDEAAAWLDDNLSRAEALTPD